MREVGRERVREGGERERGSERKRKTERTLTRMYAHTHTRS